MFGNYNFHEDSKKYVTQFIQEVHRHEENYPSPANKSNWSVIFKTMPKLDIEIETEEVENSVIDLTIDEDSNSNGVGEEIKGQPDVSANVSSTQRDNCLQDMVNTISGERGDINTDFLHTLEGDFNIDMKQFFEHLLTLTDNTVLFKFGSSLLAHNCSDKLGKSYFKFILIPLAISQLTDDIKNIFEAYIAKFSNMSHILLQFANVNANIIIDLTSSLNDVLKLKLFEDCVSNSNDIERGHIVLLDNLLTKEVSRDIIKKTINLLTVVADTYSTDKMYGKYLFKLIDTLGGDVTFFQEELNELLRRHKSIWKNKAEKMLLANVECDLNNVTQSFLV